ncbi:hypothetical protein LguiA_016547 [Lonicera macranthoides]
MENGPTEGADIPRHDKKKLEENSKFFDCTTYHVPWKGLNRVSTHDVSGSEKIYQFDRRDIHTLSFSLGSSITSVSRVHTQSQLQLLWGADKSVK